MNGSRDVSAFFTKLSNDFERGSRVSMPRQIGYREEASMRERKLSQNTCTNMGKAVSMVISG
jgi:hypothetical protein